MNTSSAFARDGLYLLLTMNNCSVRIVICAFSQNSRKQEPEQITSTDHCLCQHMNLQLVRSRHGASAQAVLEKKKMAINSDLKQGIEGDVQNAEEKASQNVTKHSNAGQSSKVLLTPPQAAPAHRQ